MVIAVTERYQMNQKFYCWKFNISQKKKTPSKIMFQLLLRMGVRFWKWEMLQIQFHLLIVAFLDVMNFFLNTCARKQRRNSFQRKDCIYGIYGISQFVLNLVIFLLYSQFTFNRRFLCLRFLKLRTGNPFQWHIQNPDLNNFPTDNLHLIHFGQTIYYLLDQYQTLLLLPTKLSNSLINHRLPAVPQNELADISR